MIVTVAAVQIGDDYRFIRPLMRGIKIGVLLILAILLVAQVDIKVAIRQRFIGGAVGDGDLHVDLFAHLHFRRVGRRIKIIGANH